MGWRRSQFMAHSQDHLDHVGARTSIYGMYGIDGMVLLFASLFASPAPLQVRLVTHCGHGLEAYLSFVLK